MLAGPTEPAAGSARALPAERTSILVSPSGAGWPVTMPLRLCHMIGCIGLFMSSWQEQKAERNRLALARLTRTLPQIFPASVLRRALGRPFVPPTPRLAIDSYWRAHPLRADRLARALAAKSGAPPGWNWQLASDSERDSGLPTTFRTPPAPYRERAHARGPGFCCICGQPAYRFGWHADLWQSGPNKNAAWHSACVVAWQFWNAPGGEARLLRRLQARRCGQTGGRLWRDAEVDHRVPLFQVWRECRGVPWPRLLGFWGLPNLQVINRIAHAAKCAAEARQRAAETTTRMAPNLRSGEVV